MINRKKIVYASIPFGILWYRDWKKERCRL